MPDKRTNAGYEIIMSVLIVDAEFVLGYNEKLSSPYVTWECSRGDYYFWGHYFAEKNNAVEDLYERAANEIAARQAVLRRSGKEPDTKKKDHREER